MASDQKRLTELTVGDAKRILVYGAMALLAAVLLVALLGRLLIALLLGVVAAVYLLPVQKGLEAWLRRREGSALVTIALIVLPLAGLAIYTGYELSSYTSLAQENRPRMIAEISRALSRYLTLLGKVHYDSSLLVTEIRQEQKEAEEQVEAAREEREEREERRLIEPTADSL